MMRQATGMFPMRTPTGLQEFHRGLASRQDQVLVLEGDLPRLEKFFRETFQDVVPPGSKRQSEKNKTRDPADSAKSHQLEKLRRLIKADLQSFLEGVN